MDTNIKNTQQFNFDVSTILLIMGIGLLTTALS